MIKHGDIAKEIIEHHNQNWLQISDHPYEISLIGGYKSEKTNILLNLIKQQNDDYDYSIINKIYLFVKDSNK